MYVCVCVCVCMCVCVCVCVRACACVWREREREQKNGHRMYHNVRTYVIVMVVKLVLLSFSYVHVANQKVCHALL